MFEDILTKEVLIKDYIKEGMTLAAIARKYNTSVRTVNLHLAKHKIKKRDYNATKNLKGQQFGRLTVLYQTEYDKHHKARWTCLCDCGLKITVNASSLTRGLTRSCGCYKIEVLRKEGYRDISKAWLRRLIKNAKSRGYAFEITPEYIWEVYEKQNKQCALSGLPIAFFPDDNRRHHQTASIDRIDNKKGYIKGNIQIVNKVVNQMKSFLSDEEFICFCNLVAERHKRKHEDCLNKTSRRILRKI